MQICLQYEAAAKQAKEERLTMKRARDVLSSIYASVHGDQLPSDLAGEYFEQWLQRKESELSESSFPEYKKIMEQFLGFIGLRKDKPLDTITKAIISDFRDDMLKRVSAATVKKYITILRAAFNDAVSEGRMRENPAATVKLKQRKSTERMPFPPETVDRLLASANAEWRGMILVGFYTGIRLGDIASMTWDNIDLPSGELRFSAQKTGRDMVIPIATPLLKYLTALPSMDTGGPLFPDCCETYSRAGASTLSNQFRRIMADAKLIEKPSHEKRGEGRNVKRKTNKWSFHCLRHSLVSGLKMAGVGDSIAKEIAGHESDEISRVYSHSNIQKLREAVNLLPALKMPKTTEGGAK